MPENFVADHPLLMTITVLSGECLEMLEIIMKKL
jgi:hypothetical protein